MIFLFGMKIKPASARCPPLLTHAGSTCIFRPTRIQHATNTPRRTTAAYTLSPLYRILHIMTSCMSCLPAKGPRNTSKHLRVVSSGLGNCSPVDYGSEAVSATDQLKTSRRRREPEAERHEGQISRQDLHHGHRLVGWLGERVGRCLLLGCGGTRR